MRLLCVVGTRPQFVKLAPILRAISEHNSSADSSVDAEVLHTGQHYDNAMSEVFFSELQIMRPGLNLEVGSASHAEQTGKMMVGIEKQLQKQSVDAVLVIGDTNSTLAAALAAAKLHVPVVHAESGLRSRNRKMPEEINRIVTDHLSDLLLAPTQAALENLRAEGLDSRAVITGDVSRDAVIHGVSCASGSSPVLSELKCLDRAFAVATVHRAENTDTDNLLQIFAALGDIADGGMPVVLPMHPRTRDRIHGRSNLKISPKIQVLPPIGYHDMLMLVQSASIVLTDSGGLQKEAFFLNTPCITLRNETEWVETVDACANIVVGADRGRIVRAVEEWRAASNGNPPDFSSDADRLFGTGDAGRRSVGYIVDAFGRH